MNRSKPSFPQRRYCHSRPWILPWFQAGKTEPSLEHKGSWRPISVQSANYFMEYISPCCIWCPGSHFPWLFRCTRFLRGIWCLQNINWCPRTDYRAESCWGENERRNIGFRYIGICNLRVRTSKGVEINTYLEGDQHRLPQQCYPQ